MVDFEVVMVIVLCTEVFPLHQDTILLKHLIDQPEEVLEQLSVEVVVAKEKNETGCVVMIYLAYQSGHQN